MIQRIITKSGLDIVVWSWNNNPRAIIDFRYTQGVDRSNGIEQICLLGEDAEKINKIFNL